MVVVVWCVAQYTKRRNAPPDHNDTLLNYKMFMALLTETDFKIHFEAAMIYGKLGEYRVSE